MKISICIPTHDGRADPLREAIDGILAQIEAGVPGEVEVCVSDNASEDGTADLMRGYAAAHPGRFVYRRNGTNLKFLKNLLQVFSLASGDYCWLLSSDDQIAAGGIAEVMETLRAYPGAAGMTVGASRYDKAMREEIGPFPAGLLPAECDRMHVYTDADAAFRACGAFVGYISVLVIDRALWQEVAAEVGEERLRDFRHFPQTFMIGGVIKKRPLWIWHPGLLVRCRTANDALIELMANNLVRYHVETMEDGARVWSALLGPRSAAHRVITGKVYPLTWGGGAVAGYKNAPCSLRDEAAALIAFTRNLYYLPSFWKSTFPVLLLPRPVIRAIFKYGMVRKLRAAAAPFRGPRAPESHAPNV